MPTIHEIVVRPVITEKSSAAFHERQEYTFEVHPKATKPAIKQAIEELFGVHVEGVWTSNRRGKTRRVGKSVGTRNNWKKAIVRLRDGETIEEIFEG